MTAYFAEHAWLPTGPHRNVRLEVTDGRWSAVHAGDAALATGAVRLPGMVFSGLANAHSHAFHRALRGRTHDGGGTCWTWRQRMYAVAERLNPDSYLQLARATYAEMVLAGVTSVGEFHYLHHAPGGSRYQDENVMAEALRQAAADAGLRITLLDTAYLAGGLDASGHLPLDAVQQRFSDGDLESWQRRVSDLAPSAGMRVGAAIHSVRAVPRAALGEVGRFAAAGLGSSTGPAPLHVHLSEQPAENEACEAYYGLSPTALLLDQGVLGPSTTAVHATHLSAADVAALGDSRTTACICPTTERDLADGIGPARALADAGAPLSLGSDQHAIIDLIEEARALEADERLASRQRGRFSQSELVTALTAHHSLGWGDAGRLEVGARADLVAVRQDSVRTAGSAVDQLLMSATAADVDTVMVDGRLIVEGGRHRLGDVGALLGAAVAPLWDER
ncbi:formimidoylglutamate deiminase [soil metagenome]